MGANLPGAETSITEVLKSLHATQLEQYAILKKIVDREAAALDSIIAENYLSAQAETSSGSQFAAQTHGIEVIESIVVSLPFGTTSASLTLGEWTIPIQNTFTCITPIRLVVRNPTRKLTWSPAGIATILIAGRATSASQGILH